MRYRYQSGNEVYDIQIEAHGQGLRATINGTSYEFEALEVQAGEVTLRLGGRTQTLYWAAEGNTPPARGRKWIALDGCTYTLERPAARRTAGGPADGHPAGGAEVRAPMPALLRSVSITEGEAVQAGQTLALLEAMKMEIRLQAPFAGNVKRILARPGEMVEKDAVIVVLGEQ